MSDSLSLNKSVSVITTNSVEVNDLQLDINQKESSSAVEIISNSIEKSLSLSGNITNVILNNETAVIDLKLSMEKPVRRKYPFTEKSKREKATIIRTQREEKYEQIKKMNEMITHGAEIIKNHSRNTRPKKFESLIKMSNNHWYHDRNVIYSRDDITQSQTLNERTEALKSNFKKIVDDFTIEITNPESEEKYTIVDDDQNNHVTCTDEQDNDTISVKEYIKSDISNLMEYLDEPKCEDEYMEILDKQIYKVAYKLENRLTSNPKYIEFKIMSMNLNTIKDKQLIQVRNRSKTPILCRYSHLFDPNSILLESMHIIKVNSIIWRRLMPGITIDYFVTFKPLELPNSKTYASLQGVNLVFETTSSNQPDIKCMFHIPIRFCMIKPEPVLVTKTIIFPAVYDSTENIKPKKFLILKNNSDVECVFSVFKETDYQKMNNTDKAVANKSLETINKRTNIFEKIITSIIYKMFCYFVWKNHIKVLLPSRGTVKVPVIFNHNFAYSTISEDYIIVFDNTDYMIPNLKINVIGHIKDNIIVKSNAIDVGLCYLTSSVQIVSFQLQSNNRVVVPFEVTVPQELCKHVELNPSKGYLKAGSSLDIFIQICLKLDILQPDCSMYLNADSGFLDFPVRIHPSNSKKYYEVRVLVVVTTPFGLKLTPDTLEFGTVNTTETVVRIVTLANHSRTTMEYRFLKLPERISVHPNAFGSILSGENVLLHIYYSPSANDLPKNVFTFEDDFILTCSTVAGLNADKFNSKFHKIITEQVSISNTKSTTSTITLNEIYELDHGPDKIPTIPILNNRVKVNPLDKNTILKEATIRCHARIHDIPVELSVQKIVFGKIHFKSYSTYTIELRASNLASVIERNTSYPAFQIRFEFCSNDPSIEFKPKNGKLHSKEVKKIIVIFRPKLNDKLEEIFNECLESEITNIETEHILEDENSFINKVYGNRPFPREQVKIFEANTIFYSLMTDLTKIVSAVCFIQFENRKSIEYFGFDTESLKLSIICQTTKPTIILFSERIDFGKCTVGVRHNEWLLVRNITTDPVPLKISLPNPVGPFFCAFALNDEKLLLPGHTTPINISFIPESETIENEILEVTSGTIRLSVNLSGGGIWPSCQISPEDTFNIILTTHERSNNTFIFRVTNTSEADVRFNVELDWAKERSEPMLDDEASEFGEMLRSWVSEDQPPWFDGPGWTGLQESNNNVFDLGNGGRPLWFSLDPDGVRQITVTFNPPPVTGQQTVRRVESEGDSDGEEDYDSPSEIFWCRVYAAMFNVHVGRKVLSRFYVIGFVEMKTNIRETSYTTHIPID